RELPIRVRLIPERECGCRCVGVAQLPLVVLGQAGTVDLWVGGHPILPAASAPLRIVSDDAMTYLPILDRSEWPSASAAAARSPQGTVSRTERGACARCSPHPVTGDIYRSPGRQPWRSSASQ